jgi:hypothetical protein
VDLVRRLELSERLPARDLLPLFGKLDRLDLSQSILQVAGYPDVRLIAVDTDPQMIVGKLEPFGHGD